jgi:hypothetical protein
MRSFMHVNRLGRGLLTAMIAAVVALGMTASIAVPADAVRTKNRKSTPEQFLAPDPNAGPGLGAEVVANPPERFRCYWIEPLHQYGCQDVSPDLATDPETRSFRVFFLNQALPQSGALDPNDPRRDNEFATPGSFRCDHRAGSNANDPANYSCAYRQGRRTVHFTLNEALTFEIRDTENPRGNFDSWFLPRPVRR